MAMRIKPEDEIAFPNPDELVVFDDVLLPNSPPPLEPKPLFAGAVPDPNTLEVGAAPKSFVFCVAPKIPVLPVELVLLAVVDPNKPLEVVVEVLNRPVEVVVVVELNKPLAVVGADPKSPLDTVLVDGGANRPLEVEVVAANNPPEVEVVEVEPNSPPEDVDKAVPNGPPDSLDCVELNSPPEDGVFAVVLLNNPPLTAVVAAVLVVPPNSPPPALEAAPNKLVETSGVAALDVAILPNKPPDEGTGFSAKILDVKGLDPLLAPKYPELSGVLFSANGCDNPLKIFLGGVVVVLSGLEILRLKRPSSLPPEIYQNEENGMTSCTKIGYII